MTRPTALIQALRGPLRRGTDRCDVAVDDTRYRVDVTDDTVADRRATEPAHTFLNRFQHAFTAGLYDDEAAVMVAYPQDGTLDDDRQQCAPPGDGPGVGRPADLYDRVRTDAADALRSEDRSRPRVDDYTHTADGYADRAREPATALGLTGMGAGALLDSPGLLLGSSLVGVAGIAAGNHAQRRRHMIRDAVADARTAYRQEQQADTLTDMVGDYTVAELSLAPDRRMQEFA